MPAWMLSLTYSTSANSLVCCDVPNRPSSADDAPANSRSRLCVVSTNGCASRKPPSSATSTPAAGREHRVRRAIAVCRSGAYPTLEPGSSTQSAASARFAVRPTRTRQSVATLLSPTVQESGLLDDSGAPRPAHPHQLVAAICIIERGSSPTPLRRGVGREPPLLHAPPAPHRTLDVPDRTTRPNR